MFQKIKLFTFSLLIAVSLSLTITPIASAQEISEGDLGVCGNSTTPYYDSFLFTAPKDTYDVYVKLGKRGQNSNVTFYVQPENDGKCRTIGSVKANGETWQRVGVWRNSSNNGQVRLQLSSSALGGLPDANRPAIMVVSKKNPVCKPGNKRECFVEVEGQKGYVKPVGTFLNEDTLHAVRVLNPDTDAIAEVRYYVDSQFVYATPKLQDFDMRYVPGGKHTIQRAIQYASGQQVVIEKQVEQSYVNDFQNALFRLSSSNRTGLKILAISFLVLLVLLLVVALIRLWYKNRRWKEAHGLTPSNTKESKVHLPHLTEKEQKFLQLSKYGLYVLGLIAFSMLFITFSNAYLAQVFTTSGVSMQNTLQDGDKLIINKSRKTWSELSGNVYTPDRGRIIVFRKAQSPFLQEIEGTEAETTYVVKRVVGLPGERVVIKAGRITVYNTENPKGFNPDENKPWTDKIQVGVDENIDVRLSSEEILVIGDNRPESVDSRFNGPIKLQDIVGEVMFKN